MHATLSKPSMLELVAIGVTTDGLSNAQFRDFRQGHSYQGSRSRFPWKGWGGSAF